MACPQWSYALCPGLRSVTLPRRATPAPSTIADVVPKGDLRASLIAIRDRLAFETDDLKWSRHKRECNCVCGMTDPRALVALTKRLEETLAAIEALPAVGGVSKLDRLADDLAARRAQRRTATSGL